MTWSLHANPEQVADRDSHPALVDTMLDSLTFTDDQRKADYRADALAALRFAADLNLSGVTVLTGWRNPRFDDPTKTALGISLNAADVTRDE